MNNKLYLILIVFLAFFLRFSFLSSIPSELNRDEASVGFNAYSLLKTGRDEHGRGPWPLVFRAFGDYKIPGYIYLTVPLIKIFGLNAFSVRFPAALFGSLTILIVYFFVKELFPKNEKLALLSAFILSLTPFHIQYSRQQFEAPVALFFSLTGLIFLLKARKIKGYFFLALPFFVCSFFIYNSPLFIVPLLVIWTIFIYRKTYLGSKSLIFSLFFLILLGVFWLGYWNLVKEGNKGRANTTIFNQIKLVEQINHNIYYLSNNKIPQLFSRMFFNKPLEWGNEFFKNYLSAFNPKFIFFTSDNNPWHSLGYLGFGNLQFTYIPFILIGIYWLIKNINLKENIWLAGYFLISPIANAFTIDSPILTRLMDFHVILVIFSAFGLYFSLIVLKKYFYWKMIIVLILIFTTSRYLITYFLIFPKQMESFWLSGIKEVSLIVKNEEPNFDLVIFDTSVELAYIFPAFYIPFNPLNFQANAKRITIGFDTVTSYEKFIFNKDINDFYQNRNIRLTEEGNSNKKILLVKKLNQEYNYNKTDNETIIYDDLGRALWLVARLNSDSF